MRTLHNEMASVRVILRAAE
ncbi:phage integrase N-terminal domain-containing protein [Pectobacterium brasiliense]